MTNNAFKEFYATAATHTSNLSEYYTRKDGTKFKKDHLVVRAALADFAASRNITGNVTALRHQAIAEDYHGGMNAKDVAAKYGISTSTVYRAVKTTPSQSTRQHASNVIVLEDVVGTQLRATGTDDAVAAPAYRAQRRSAVYGSADKGATGGETPQQGAASSTPANAPAPSSAPASTPAPAAKPAGPNELADQLGLNDEPAAAQPVEESGGLDEIVEEPAAQPPAQPADAAKPAQPQSPPYKAIPVPGQPAYVAPAGQLASDAVTVVEQPLDVAAELAAQAKAASEGTAAPAAQPPAEQPAQPAPQAGAPPADENLTIIDGQLDPANHPHGSNFRHRRPEARSRLPSADSAEQPAAQPAQAEAQPAAAKPVCKAMPVPEAEPVPEIVALPADLEMDPELQAPRKATWEQDPAKAADEAYAAYRDMYFTKDNDDARDEAVEEGRERKYQTKFDQLLEQKLKEQEARFNARFDAQQRAYDGQITDQKKKVGFWKKATLAAGLVAALAAGAVGYSMRGADEEATTRAYAAGKADAENASQPKLRAAEDAARHDYQEHKRLADELAKANRANAELKDKINTPAVQPPRPPADETLVVKLAEAQRKADREATARQQAEDARRNAEDARRNAENARKNADAALQKAEGEREAAKRNAAENERKAKDASDARQRAEQDASKRVREAEAAQKKAQQDAARAAAEADAARAAAKPAEPQVDPARVAETQRNAQRLANPQPHQPVYIGGSGRELSTVLVANPGKGPDLTGYYDDDHSGQYTNAQKDEQRIQELMRQTGTKSGTAAEAKLRQDYFVSKAFHKSEVFAGHGSAATALAAAYTNGRAAIFLQQQEGTLSPAQARTALDELVCTYGNRHYEGDVREGQKQVRRFSSARDVLKLEAWKGTADISRLLTESGVDVYKHFDASKVQGASQAAQVARTFTAQLYAVQAEDQFSKLLAAKKAGQGVDMTQFCSFLYNASLADIIGVDKEVDKSMKAKTKEALKLLSESDRKKVAQENAVRVAKKIKEMYGKQLSGEAGHDAWRAFRSFLAEVVPGVMRINTDYRHLSDMPSVSGVEKAASTLLTVDTLKGVLDLTGKYEVRNEQPRRELARLYGYTLLLNADRTVRASNGAPSLDDALRVATDFEKAEMVFRAIDESRGEARELAAKLRKSWENEIHDKYDVDRMFARNLAERELMLDLAQGEDLLKGLKEATLGDIINQIRKAAQWTYTTVQLTSGSHGGGHKPHKPSGNKAPGGGEIQTDGITPAGGGSGNTTPLTPGVNPDVPPTVLTPGSTTVTPIPGATTPTITPVTPIPGATTPVTGPTTPLPPTLGGGQL